jgi:hypothetical protein
MATFATRHGAREITASNPTSDIRYPTSELLFIVLPIMFPARDHPAAAASAPES